MCYVVVVLMVLVVLVIVAAAVVVLRTSYTHRKFSVKIVLFISV